jgi:hypothetical protein
MQAALRQHELYAAEEGCSSSRSNGSEHTEDKSSFRVVTMTSSDVLKYMAEKAALQQTLTAHWSKLLCHNCCSRFYSRSGRQFCCKDCRHSWQIRNVSVRYCSNSSSSDKSISSKQEYVRHGQSVPQCIPQKQDHIHRQQQQQQHGRTPQTYSCAGYSSYSP